MRTDDKHKELIRTSNAGSLRRAVEAASMSVISSECVYVASTLWTQNWFQGEQSVYKIGRTTNPRRRRQDLRSGKYWADDILHVIPCRYAELVELALHTLFQDMRFHHGGRELFILPPNDYQWLTAIPAVHGGHIIQFLLTHQGGIV